MKSCRLLKEVFRNEVNFGVKILQSSAERYGRNTFLAVRSYTTFLTHFVYFQRKPLLFTNLQGPPLNIPEFLRLYDCGLRGCRLLILHTSHLKCLLASNNAKSNREKSIAVGGVLLVGVGSRKRFLILVFLFRMESSQSHGHFHHLLRKITVIPEK